MSSPDDAKKIVEAGILLERWLKSIESQYNVQGADPNAKRIVSEIQSITEAFRLMQQRMVDAVSLSSRFLSLPAPLQPPIEVVAGTSLQRAMLFQYRGNATPLIHKIIDELVLDLARRLIEQGMGSFHVAYDPASACVRVHFRLAINPGVSAGLDFKSAMAELQKLTSP